MLPYTEKDYQTAHKFCTKHSDKLRYDKICGCFHCLAIFSPDDITNWLTEKKRVVNDQSVCGQNTCGQSTCDQSVEWITDEQQTALCPHCGVDSVLGESCGYPLTSEFLVKMREHWFSAHRNEDK